MAGPNLPSIPQQGPAVMPGLPAGGAHAPVLTLNQQAARGAGSVLGCAACGIHGVGPSIGDVAPPTALSAIPTWAKLLGAFTFLGVVVGVGVYASRR